MKTQTIFRMASPYRDDFRIKAYTFGEGAKSLCVVGAMRGDELQQQYIASRLVRLLSDAEREGRIARGVSISVVPSANPSSVNIEKRFWALDNTDINRMFPGYDKGETTQRIAAGLFEFVKDFRYGVQLASFYMPGVFLPHVRLCRTGYEDVASARLFGLPYVAVSEAKPIDTVLLNYNWQLWGCAACSLYAGSTDTIDAPMVERALAAVLRFARRAGLLAPAGAVPDAEADTAAEAAVEVIDDSRLVSVQAPHAGILLTACRPGDHVKAGQRIAQITHPYEGTVVADIAAPATGTVLFVRDHCIAYQNTLLFRIVAQGQQA